jgi:cytochrome b
VLHVKETSSKVNAWTVFVRLTHWLIACCVMINFFNDTGFWHRFIGYACITLVFLRLVYGLWLSKEPSSAFYIPNIANIKMHISALKAKQHKTYIGHNPLGQWAVYAMWVLLLLLVLSGWMSRTDDYWGEDWPVDIHLILSRLLQALVVLHLLAIIVISNRLKQNLVKAMVLGESSKKALTHSESCE